MFYDTFVHLANEKGLKPSRVADDVGINRSTVTGWKQRGSAPGPEILAKIAAYFGVSTDYLLGKTEIKTPVLTEEDERDIDKQVDALLSGLDNETGLMLDGVPASAEAVELFRESLAKAIRDAKLVNKLQNKQ